MLALLTPMLARLGISEAEAWAKRLEPVLIALMILAAAGAAYLWAHGRGVADQKMKDASAITAITQQRDSWITAFHQSDGNFHTAIDIANREAASIMALKKDGEERARNAKAQIADALKRNAALTAQGRALTDSAGRHYSSAEPCSSSGAYMTAKDM